MVFFFFLLFILPFETSPLFFHGAQSQNIGGLGTSGSDRRSPDSCYFGRSGIERGLEPMAWPSRTGSQEQDWL